MFTRAFWALALTVAAAFAIAGGDAFDEHCANLAILQNKAVQKDVGVTQAQRAKLNTHANWFNAEMAKLRKAYEQRAKGSKTPLQPPVSEIQSLDGQMKARVLRELTAGQVKRLREISLQQAGDLAVMDGKVATKIGVTAAQLKTLRDAYKKNGTAAAKIEKAALQPILSKYQAKKPATQAEAKQLQSQFNVEVTAAKKKIAPKLTALAKKYKALLDKTLSAGQKTALKDLRGKPFKAK